VAPERLANWYSHPLRRFTREALVVMARVPSDTRGKSRLTRDLGGDRLELRRALLLDTLDAASGADADLFLACEPADSIAEMRGLAGEGARLFPQQGDTLGDRMRNAFRHLFAAGYSTVVMIGSDLPSLPTSHVAQAFQYLRERPDAVVIGPATDGGYYLIGLRRLCPALFTPVALSAADVLTTTTTVAETCGLIVSFVSPWHDVDTVDDLRRVLRDPHGATRTRAWVTAHGLGSKGSKGSIGSVGS
jgi:rSAM/selenodomain-associated transferase 1